MSGLSDGVAREAYSAAVNIVDHAIGAIGTERRKKPYAERRIVVVPGFLQYGDVPYRPLSEKFRKEDSVEIVASNTFFWNDLRYSSQKVADQIAAMGGRVIDALVGQSMGGLIVTKVAQTPGIRERIRNVICLATPFGGTPFAYLALATASARQMIPKRYAFGFFRNQFLEELENGEYDPRTRVVHIYGEEDMIVPVESAIQGRAHEKIGLSEVGHWSLLYDDRVHQIIRERILKPQTKNPETVL